MINESLWRYERKFVIPNYSAFEVVLSLLLHPLGFREIYWERRVNSLYLDSEELDLVNENYEGTPQKTKVRVRWYGEDVSVLEKPTLEIKSKYGSIGKKTSVDFPDFANIKLDKGISLKEYKDIVDNSSIPEELKVKLSLLEPTIITSYRRRYFQSFDRNFRATIDFDMKFYEPSNMIKFVPQDSSYGLVLEIKYDTEHDLLAQQILHKLPFRLGKYSKYVTGMGELWAY